LSAFHLSPSAPDHLSEHPGREPTKINAAGFGEAPDKTPEASPESAYRIEFSQVETQLI